MIYPIDNLQKISAWSFRFVKDTEVLGNHIPGGFVTDGASVPFFFWWFLSPFHVMFPAAIVHDFQCMTAQSQKARRKADKEFYRNLRRCGLKLPWRLMAYYPVRVYSIYRITFFRNPHPKKERKCYEPEA